MAQHKTKHDGAIRELEIAPAASRTIEREPETHIKTEGVLEAQLKSRFDDLSIWQALLTFKKATMICVLVGIAASTDGYQNSLSGSIVANKGFIAHFTSEPKLNPHWVSIWSGMTSVGLFLGPIAGSFAADSLGRKFAMYVSAALLIIGASIEVTSTVWWEWIIAKVFTGMGVSVVSAVLPVYINEHAPVQIRGILLVTYSMWSNLGGLLASVALQTRNKADPLDWKTPIYTQFGMIGAFLLAVFWLPESPWWLARVGKQDKALAVLKWKYDNVEDYDIQHEMAIINSVIEQQLEWELYARAQGPFAVFQGLNGKRFLIGCYPKVLQTFVGLSVFSTNAAYFFQLAGNKDPFLVTVLIGSLGIVAALFDASLVDKIGRRAMTLIGFSGACLGMLIIAIVGCVDYKNPQLGSLLVFGGVFAGFFSTFQSTTSYAYLTEMPEIRLRARSTGFGLAFSNLPAILINFTLPLMLNVWSVRSAFFFVCTGIPGTILAYIIMPESCQRSPAEIQEMFVDHVPLRKWKGYKTTVELDLEARERSHSA